MQRFKKQYPFAEADYEVIKTRMLDWAQQFSILLFLDSNEYPDKYGQYRCLLGVQAGERNGSFLTTLEDIQSSHDANKDWLLGHICYDYKNKLEPILQSDLPTGHSWPVMRFFCPDVICYVERHQNVLTIESLTDNVDRIYHTIINILPVAPEKLPRVSFNSRLNKDEYIDIIEQLRSHIKEGDCYEINFCNEGYTQVKDLNCYAVSRKLNALSPSPFAAYYRLQHQYMMCSSPERYIRKHGNKIISQPIKGTARRDTDQIKDEVARNELQQNIKERAENIMITDLVRNDLARSCDVGSIRVEELCAIYSFPQVHQMISTVSGHLQPERPFTDAIRYSFPMGSMTGAPKVKVMKLIEEYETVKRSIFSGSVGYISPEGDFDFNVIIRSLFYNADTGYLSYQTGGAITYDSIPVKEWQEMRLKAWAMERLFT